MSPARRSTWKTVLSPVTEIGMAAYPRDGTDGAQLIIRATATLARPGTRGGQLRLAEPVSAQSARERYVLEQDLAQAIAEDQLTMVFQPVVDLRAGRMIGAEALLRWDHPRLGAVSPAKFIPVVETMGLGERYGLWVLNAACREARRWRELGTRGHEGRRQSVGATAAGSGPAPQDRADPDAPRPGAPRRWNWN
jgi:predicted signal transduction protein with EAL and GGDEF domain